MGDPPRGTLSRMAIATHHRGHRYWLGSALAAILVLAACSSSPAPVTPGAAGSAVAASPVPPSATDETSPGPSTTDGTSSPEPQAEADSTGKIDAAEAAGTIDHDTALVDKLYASLDYASLPAEYRSSNPATLEATTILAELSDRLDQLPPDLRAKVTPFLLRPDDPGSFWQQRLARTASGSARFAAFTASVEMDSIDADVAPVRVWFATPLGASERDLAVRLADEIDRSQMFDKERVAMLGHVPCTDNDLTHNGGSSRLDIYLVYPETGLDWGGRSDTLGFNEENQPNNGVDIKDGEGDSGCPVATHMIVNGSLDFEHLKSTTAHEMFHAFQYSFRNAVLPDRNWWSEASATWAKDLVYPTQNFEQDYLESYWSDAQGAEGPIDSVAGTAEYATYLLPFYLVQQSGDRTGTAVGRLWQASESTAPLTAIAALQGWIDRFKEFALWNWNKAAAMKYVDAGAPIPAAKLSQKPTCMDSHIVAGDPCYLELGKMTLNLDLDRASVQYYEGVPDAPTIELLKFDLTDVQSKPGLGVQAILTYGDASRNKIEDWTGTDKHQFCVNRDDLRSVVLVVSNSNIGEGQKQTGGIKTEGLPTGCSTGHYSIDVANVNGGTHKGTGHHEGDGQVICAKSGADWTVYAVYFPNDPDGAGRDISDFHITTTPGNQWVSMTLMDHTTDSPTDWSVMTAFQGRFSFQTDDHVKPWTITATGDDHSQHISITATCSVMDAAP
jgi:hypothetical protein